MDDFAGQFRSLSWEKSFFCLASFVPEQNLMYQDDAGTKRGAKDCLGIWSDRFDAAHFWLDRRAYGKPMSGVSFRSFVGGGRASARSSFASRGLAGPTCVSSEKRRFLPMRGGTVRYGTVRYGTVGYGTTIVLGVDGLPKDGGL